MVWEKKNGGEYPKVVIILKMLSTQEKVKTNLIIMGRGVNLLDAVR